MRSKSNSINKIIKYKINSSENKNKTEIADNFIDFYNNTIIEVAKNITGEDFQY